MTVAKFLWLHVRKFWKMLAVTVVLFISSFAINRIGSYVAAELVSWIAKASPADIDFDKFIWLMGLLFGITQLQNNSCR